MNINNTNGTSLAELKNTAMSFDRASCKDVFIGDDKKKSENYVAIYNENKQDVCAIASTDYKIVQHQDFANAIADSLNLNHSIVEFHKCKLYLWIFLSQIVNRMSIKAKSSSVD